MTKFSKLAKTKLEMLQLEKEEKEKANAQRAQEDKVAPIDQNTQATDGNDGSGRIYKKVKKYTGPIMYILNKLKQMWDSITGRAKNIYAKIATFIMKMLPEKLKKWLSEKCDKPLLAELTEKAAKIFGSVVLAKIAVVIAWILSATGLTYLYLKIKKKLPRFMQWILDRIEEAMYYYGVVKSIAEVAA